MLREVESPRIVQSAIACYSALLDQAQYRVSTAQELGLELPASLHTAVPKRQAEFIAGRYCARQAIRRLGWSGDVELAVRPDQLPLWPSGTTGSITHTRTFVSAAVAYRRDVRSIGIDCEHVVDRRIAKDIRDSVLCDSERSLLAGALDREPQTLMTLVFSAKESIFKCFYPVVGLLFDFTEAEIFGIDVRTGYFRYRLLKNLSPEFGSGYIGSGRFHLENETVHTAVELGWQDAREGRRETESFEKGLAVTNSIAAHLSVG